MRNLAIAMAFASTILASPALARDDSWYVGVEGGPSIIENQTIDIGVLKNAGIAKLKSGYDAGGTVGYDFGGFRLEAETAYKKGGLTNYSSTTTTADRGSATGPLLNVPAGNFSYAGGKSSALSFMLNGLLDFGEDDGVQGFVGGGVGVARVKNVYGISSFQNFLNDSDTGLAWQGVAGIRAPLSGNWDAGIKYRFFNAPNVDLVDANGRANSTKFRSHSLLGTLTYNFGGAPAVTAPVQTPVVQQPVETPVVEQPVVQPPVEQPVQVQRQCNTGPYIVFFDWDKADITAEASAILDNAAAAYGDCGNAQVMLAGHADKSGKPSYNVRLSERRNANVRSYLVGKGIADGVISTQAFGEGAPKVETADGVRELQNRRVEVTYGPGSGN